MHNGITLNEDLIFIYALFYQGNNVKVIAKRKVIDNLRV